MTIGRRLVLHIGTSKSGTTAFQRAAVHSRGRLSELDVGQPYADRLDVVRGLLVPLGWEAGSGFIRQPDDDAVARLVSRLRARPESVLLVSCEDLCELGRQWSVRILEAVEQAGYEVDVVVTARDWGRQLPSEWQQFLKHRLTDDFPTFLENVRTTQGFYGRHFRRRQDLAGILRRWGSHLPPERVHVAAVPRRSEDPDAVFGTLTGLLGLTPEALELPAGDVNASFGYVEAEVYRRLNVELSLLRPNHRRRTFPAVRELLASGVLKRANSSHVRLPPEAFGWVRDESEEQVDAVRAAGVRLLGDVADLLPRQQETAPMPTIDEAQVAQSAVETLAAFAVRAVIRPAQRRRSGPAARRPTTPDRRWRWRGRSSGR